MNIKILCSLQKKYFCKKKIGTIYSYNLKRTMKIQKKKIYKIQFSRKKISMTGNKNKFNLLNKFCPGKELI